MLKANQKIILDKFKDEDAKELKQLFIDYPYKNFQLKNIGIDKNRMVDYLIDTISGKDIFNYSAYQLDKLKAFISLRKLNMLSKFFDYSIYSIRHFLKSNDNEKDPQLLLNYALSSMLDADVITSKVASDDISIIHSLETNSFNFVGNQIDLILNLNEYNIDKSIDENNISLVKEDELSDVLRIIEMVHTKNPYAYDPNFDNDLVKKLYQKITVDAAKEKSYKIFVYKINSKIIGFITMKYNYNFSAYSKKKCASLDFIGVDKNEAFKGLGVQLNIYVLNMLKSEGYDICAVKTLSDNYSALRICNKLGFKITGSSLLFHKWRDK
jgi:L-amino acid N-acyltransferase YncA